MRPLVHDRDPVRHRERLVLVVGHDHEGDPDLVLQADELELHLLAQLLVERRERLVEQQNLGPLDQGAGQRHPLALAARELVGPAQAEAVEADHGERRLDPRADLGARRAADAQAVADVVGDRHVREKRRRTGTPC